MKADTNVMTAPIRWTDAAMNGLTGLRCLYIRGPVSIGCMLLAFSSAPARKHKPGWKFD